MLLIHVCVPPVVYTVDQAKELEQQFLAVVHSSPMEQQSHLVITGLNLKHHDV